MTNSKRRLHETLTSSVEKVTGASMGIDRVTEDWIRHGVSSCHAMRGKKKETGSGVVCLRPSI